MSTVLFKAFAFLLMIGLGYLFKSRGILRPDDSQVVMKIMMNITMPAALMSGFRDFSLDFSLAFAILLGFFFNIFLMAAGYLLSRRHEPYERALYLLYVPTFNLGNFVLPFVQGFFPSSAVVILSMFDAGNNPIGAGIAYSAASSAAGGKSGISLKDILYKLFHSPPFLSYFVMSIICILGIHLPDACFDLIEMFGQGNCFLAMFTIGLIFELHLPREDTFAVLRILVIRYGLCIAGAAVLFFFSPFPLLTRQVMALCMIGPATTLSVAYGLKIGCRQSMIASLCSLCLLISFILSMGLMFLWA